MRKLVTALMTLGLVLALGATALAGNMAITSFDSLPEDFVAGNTYTLTYTVLQHGVTPVDGNSALIFTGVGTGEVLTYEAEPTGEPGRYRVEVMIPSEGAWEWQVTQGPFEAQQMGVLTVGAGTGDAAAASSPWIAVLRVLLPLGTLAAAWFTVREVARTRSARARVMAQPE